MLCLFFIVRYNKRKDVESEASGVQWKQAAQHIIATHRNWLWLHVGYILVLALTFFAWGIIGAMYFATKFSQGWANVGFILYAATIISLPAIVVHIRAGFTYHSIWQWRWSILAQLLYYIVSAVLIVIIMLCVAYV